MGEHMNGWCVHNWVGISAFGPVCSNCGMAKDVFEAKKYRPHSLLALEPPTGHVKHDRTKTRYDLIPVAPLRDIADVLTYGAAKYTPNNWAKGCEWSRYYNALRRHLEAWWGGEDNDPESSKSHLACAGCSLLFLMSYEREGLGTDDRRKV